MNRKDINRFSNNPKFRPSFLAFPNCEIDFHCFFFVWLSSSYPVAPCDPPPQKKKEIVKIATSDFNVIGAYLGLLFWNWYNNSVSGRCHKKETTFMLGVAWQSHRGTQQFIFRKWSQYIYCLANNHQRFMV